MTNRTRAAFNLVIIAVLAIGLGVAAYFGPRAVPPSFPPSTENRR